MRVLIQRVAEAKVIVDEVIKGKIQKGYLLYICFETNDNEDTIRKAIKKISQLRVFSDENDRMNLTIKDVKGEILSISQFTLSWRGEKGNRPNFTSSMPSEKANTYYLEFNQLLKSEGIHCETGVFGADMKVHSINDGPVTFFLDF